MDQERSEQQRARRAGDRAHSVSPRGARLGPVCKWGHPKCFWTVILAGGQITAEGPFSDNFTDTTLAITGGTGTYKDAHGQMTFSILPLTSEAFGKLSWSQIEPWYHELLATELTSVTLDAWMIQWSHLSALVDETFVQHEIATTTNTADESRAQRKQQFMDMVYVTVQDLDQQIKEHLLASGLTPEGFEVPLRNLRMETGIFCEANLALLKEDRELSDAYYALGGAQTVQWEGKEVPMSTIEPVLEDADRAGVKRRGG